MRLLEVIWLSDLTDASTSPERQREKNHTYARLHDHKIVATAEDLDVSGSVSPFDRAALGPWLTEERADQYDGLIVAKLDRLTRSLFDFLHLWHWLDNRGKVLICIEPSLDMTTPAGRAFASIIATFAEFERETIRDRVRDSYHHVRRNGGYPGGTVPFGYVPVRAEPKGWKLVPDPELAEIVREMVRRYLAGQSFHQIKDWLNETGVPASRDAQRQRNGKPVKGRGWTSSPVRRVLSSPHLSGHLVDTNDEPVRDEDGIAITIEPLLDEATYQRLQAALADRAYSPRANANKLLGVAFCMCGQPLYTSVTKSRGQEYRYLHCHGSRFRLNGCTAKRIRAALLEHMTETAFLAMVGDVEVLEPVPVAGEDHSKELAQVQEAIAALEDQYVLGTIYSGAAGAERFASMMGRLEERRVRLATMPCKPPRTDWLPTGETFRQRWQKLDAAGQRLLMVESKFRVGAVMNGGRLELAMELDPNLACRAGLAASGQAAGERPAGEPGIIRPVTVLHYAPPVAEIFLGGDDLTGTGAGLAQRVLTVQRALQDAERRYMAEQARPLSDHRDAARARKARAERKGAAA